MNNARFYGHMWVKTITPLIKARFKDKCAICGRVDTRAHVHHMKYEDATIYDLLLLCNGCHRAIHHTDLKVLLEIKKDILKGIDNATIVKRYNLPRLRVFRFRKRLETRT